MTVRPPLMLKVLVFAHTPPPIHGQSVMVAALLGGLRGDPEVQLVHVNARLSRDTADVGRWRPGKLLSLLGACFNAGRRRREADVFYYVPAPGKRSALYRDFIVMLLCRPFFPRLVLHWHAAGLGAWLETSATAPERWLARRLLGHADLAIVLGENLRQDVAPFAPKKIAVVRNGLADPCPGFVRPPRDPSRPLSAVFLGLCTREKGLLDAVAGVRAANAAGTRVTLAVAGDFPTPAAAAEFAAATRDLGDTVRAVGFLSGEKKHALLAGADVLLFPTVYPHETQGLVVAEALAHDLPVIVTRWRAVPEGLPERNAYVVEPGQPEEIAQALALVQASPPSAGAARRHFLTHLTLASHLAAMKAAFLSLGRG